MTPAILHTTVVNPESYRLTASVGGPGGPFLRVVVTCELGPREPLNREVLA